MSPTEFIFRPEECDLTGTTLDRLNEYRNLRLGCMRDLVAVTEQLQDMAWDTVVFNSIREGIRRKTLPRPNRTVLQLLVDGYVAKSVLCIRRALDKDSRTHSLHRVVKRMQASQRLLTRAHYVCYDGLPYDYEVVLRQAWEQANIRGELVIRSPAHGPLAYGSSEAAHRRFDAICGKPSERSHRDRIVPDVFERLLDEMKDPLLQHVSELVNKRVAHYEQLPPGEEDRIYSITFDELEVALLHLVRITRFISEELFNDSTFGDVVPTAQFDQLKNFDQGWTDSEALPAIREHWDAAAARLNSAAYDGLLLLHPFKPVAR